MGVWLTPNRETVEALKASWWTWRPVVTLLRQASVLDLERIGPIPDSSLYAEIDAEQAARIATFLDSFLRALEPDQRVLLDSTLTDVPDTYEFYRTESELHRNYSAEPEWLARFCDFCRVCDGFTIS
jgi:hypothetical protein